jgi:hypothetical protein
MCGSETIASEASVSNKTVYIQVAIENSTQFNANESANTKDTEKEENTTETDQMGSISSRPPLQQSPPLTPPCTVC